LNVVIYRLPRGENLAFPASHCTSCGAPIRAIDNLPLLGWLRLGGRARCCKAPISGRYPLVELLGALLGGTLIQVAILTLPPETLLWQAGLLFAAELALGLGLLAAAFIDLSRCRAGRADGAIATRRFVVGKPPGRGGGLWHRLVAVRLLAPEVAR
jgi:leader peptidase (prepilin peptidase)/N-methyltransferase